jgi:hypothetical protein
MNDEMRDRLLGGNGADPGCEACFELLDQYAEAVLRADDAARRFPEVVAHIASCEACREDTEGLLAALRREATDEPR